MGRSPPCSRRGLYRRVRSRYSRSTLGKYLYVSNYEGVNPYITACPNGCGFVSQFTIGRGRVAHIHAHAHVLHVGPYPAGGAVHPTKPWYYVANSEWSSVSQNTIGADGALASMTAPTVATQNNPQAIAIDPSGKWAYVANGTSNCVSQFNIDQTTGELTSMSTPTVATGVIAPGISKSSRSLQAPMPMFLTMGEQQPIRLDRPV